MELFVSAGEASSDIHCAHLIGELKKIAAQNGVTELRTFGLGGDSLVAQGTELVLHNREFSVMGGPLEVISKIPLRRKLELKIERELFSGRIPKGAILVDNGEINLRLASLLHFFKVPVVYFIPPKVWVWRPSRIEKIKQHVDLVLSILPFEEPIYRNWEIPFEYVGNPLIDEIDTKITADEAKKNLGIEQSRDVLTVFLGSRHSEIRHHNELFGEAINLFMKKLPSHLSKPLIVMPAAPAIDPSSLAEGFSPFVKEAGADIKVVKGMSHDCLRAARAALVKSGTSTLEAAVLGTPMVLAYQSSRSSRWVYRHIVRYRGFVGMVNLFLADSAESALGWSEKKAEPAVPELILERANPIEIAQELFDIYIDGPKREKMKSELARARSLLSPPKSSSAPGEVSENRDGSPIFKAAELVWKTLR